MTIEQEGNKLNFILGVFTPFSKALSGGVVAMHKLANSIANRGHNVYIFCEPEFPHSNIKVIPSTLLYEEGFVQNYRWEGFSFPLNTTISIYPQITRGNPFNTKYVSRWIMYDTERDIEDGYDKDDVYFNYGNFKTFRNEEHRELTVFNYYFDKLYKTNFGNRKTFCHIIHKHTPPNGLEIFEKLNSEDLTNWKTMGEYDYLREKLNEYKYFLTYDQKTFYTLAAGLCGTQSIILNPGPSYEFSGNAFSDSEDYNDIMTPTEYRLKNKIQMFGVAYGWEDLCWAEKTIDLVPDYLRELDKIDNKSVDKFINFWKNKVGVQ
jgi:hypothetical protein